MAALVARWVGRMAARRGYRRTGPAIHNDLQLYSAANRPRAERAKIYPNDYKHRAGLETMAEGIRVCLTRRFDPKFCQQQHQKRHFVEKLKTMENAKEKVQAAIELARAVVDVIKGAGEEGIPSGHLYAMVCGKLSLETYNSLIDLLKRSKLVTERNFVLRAI